MVKQLLLPLAAVAAFIVLVGLFTQRSSSINWSKFIPSMATPAPTQQVKVGNKVVNVEIAKTDSERKKGLSGRNSLEENSGMLFVFDSEKITPVFWMKGMKMSIDIIWINQGKVVKIDKNLPVPSSDAKDSSLIKYSPSMSVDSVLEVSAGFSDSNNIKVGDEVVLPTI